MLILFESESAPFASCGCVFVSLVKLNVLHGMTQSQLIHSHASSHISVNFNNWQVINKFLCICFVAYSRNLHHYVLTFIKLTDRLLLDICLVATLHHRNYTWALKNTFFSTTEGPFKTWMMQLTVMLIFYCRCQRT